MTFNTNIAAIISEEEFNEFQVIEDKSDATLIYIGKSRKGVGLSQAAWQIGRITEVSSISLLEWSGEGLHAFTWDDRAALFGPTDLEGAPGNEENTLSWSAVSQATSYNLYWSTTKGIDASTTTKITGITSPYVHTGLTNETTYYYRLEAITPLGSSTLSNETSSTPEAFVNAFSLQSDGVDEWVDLGNIASFERNVAWSTSFYFKYSATTGAIIGKRQGSATYKGWAANIVNGLLGWNLSSDNPSGNRLIVRTDDTFNDGSWYHCVMTYDGSSSAAGVNIYVDASNKATTAVSDSLTGTIITTNKATLCARDEGGDNFFDGKIDEVAIYDKELSQAEVTEIYNGGVPADLAQLSIAANLYAWWRFTQTDKDNFPNITDASNNSRPGTAINMEAGDIQGDTP